MTREAAEFGFNSPRFYRGLFFSNSLQEREQRIIHISVIDFLKNLCYTNHNDPGYTGQKTGGYYYGKYLRRHSD